MTWVRSAVGGTPSTTDDVTNVSGVAGATASDALDDMAATVLAVAGDLTTEATARSAADSVEATARAAADALLDPTKINVFEVVYPMLGGTIRWRVMAPNGQMVTVHRTEYPNSATVPSQRNPTYRVGWAAASLGSTTALAVKGTSAAAFTEGPREFERDPYSSSVYSFSATTTETVALALRSRAEFGSTNNQREVVPLTLEAGTDTATRTVLARLVVNPTYSTTPDWSYASQTESSVEVATPSGVTVTGGREVINMIFSSGSAARLDLRPLDLRLEPGDTLAICLRALSNTATCIVATTRQEI